MSSKSIKELAVQLFDIGAVKLGDIEAKMGRRTPIYFDLRVVISHPDVMMAVAKQLEMLIPDKKFDVLCGVPYAALPFATVMSINTKIPMIMKRKERKVYGTKNMVEGVFKKHQNCLIIEDVVTSGGSLMETVQAMRAEKLKVTDALVVLDREQGGASVLSAHGVQIHSLLFMKDLINILQNAGRINEETARIIFEHIEECQFGMKDNADVYGS